MYPLRSVTALVRHPLKLALHPVRFCLLLVAGAALLIPNAPPSRTLQHTEAPRDACHWYRERLRECAPDAAGRSPCARARQAYEDCIDPFRQTREELSLYCGAE